MPLKYMQVIVMEAKKDVTSETGTTYKRSSSYATVNNGKR